MPPRASDVWVGLLARRCRPSGPAAASPSPAFDGRVVVRSGVLTHSGGTAPDSHRTSLLFPSRAPRQGRVLYHGFCTYTKSTVTVWPSLTSTDLVSAPNPSCHAVTLRRPAGTFA